jgi:dipeptidyl aminopeptidase/acylaminoacyl peptidase
MLSGRTQGNFIQKPNSEAATEQWDLNKYIWSHQNYKTGKNDKPVLDFDAMNNWLSAGKERDEVSISSDGKYIAYTTRRGVDYSTIDSLIIQSTDNTWRKALKIANTGFFSADSKKYIYLNNSAIGILELGTDHTHTLTDVQSYKLPKGGQNEWLAFDESNKEVILYNLVSGGEKRIENVGSYQFDESTKWFISKMNGSEEKLWLYNLSTRRELSFSNVFDYLISESGNNILIKKEVGLELVDMVTGKTFKISIPEKEGPIISFNLDKSGEQVVIVLEKIDVSKAKSRSIWYYKKGADKPVQAVFDNSNNVNAETSSIARLGTSANFSPDGHYIQFNLERRRKVIKPVPGMVQVAVWSYKDTLIQSEQRSKSGELVFENLHAIWNIATSRITVLAEREQIQQVSGNYAVVIKLGNSLYENRYWENTKDSIWLLTLNTEKKIFLYATKRTPQGVRRQWISPQGNYLIYFDAENGCNYFSYNLKSGKTSKISEGIPAWQLGDQPSRNSPSYYAGHRKWQQPIEEFGEGLAGWLPNEDAVLVYDYYDIWQLDPSGKKAPISFTNNYGREHNTILEFSDHPKNKDCNDVLTETSLLLTAFNIKTKYNGYYKKALGGKGNPEVLNMDACVMQKVYETNLEDGMEPIKARDANIWLVRKQTDKMPSNFFITKDFKTYKQISNFQSFEAFNWYTKELQSYKALDGKNCEGILYKPENFDSTRKYPIIIIFYDRFADNLYSFPGPDYNANAVQFGFNPGWLESHGYLVFTPSIHVAPLEYGSAALNIVEGAVNYLKQFSFVDERAISACSHSFSAKLGAYVFTHSHSFAATVISEGVAFSNPISWALSLGDNLAESELSEMEVGFEYGNLWEHKRSWIDQTTVLNVDQSISPLLLFCGNDNGRYSASRINQTVQLYSALRRLEKKTWWLQYEKGGHNVGGNEAKDFTIRFTQYMDHYLKRAPAPRWMTQGSPYALKGVENRLELDPNGTCDLPNKKECAVCAAWNKQYKRTPSMFDKPNSEWKLDDDIKKELDKKETERYRKNMAGEAQRIKENNDKLGGIWKGEKY